MNADIKIETVGSYDISQNLYVYNSTLYLKNVTLDTPSTYLCEINDKFKEISLTIKGKRLISASHFNYKLNGLQFTESNESISIQRNKQRACV